MTKKEIVKRLLEIGENVVFDWDFYRENIHISLLTDKGYNDECTKILDELYLLLEDIENDSNCYYVEREAKDETYSIDDRDSSFEVYVLF